MKRTVWALVLAALLLVPLDASAVRAQDGGTAIIPPSGLVSWWPGEENPDVTDNFNDNSLDPTLWEIKNFVIEWDNIWTTVDQMSLQERNQRVEIYGTRTFDVSDGQGWFGKALVSKLEVDPTKDFTLESKLTMAGNFTGLGQSDSAGHIGISIDQNNWIAFGIGETSGHGIPNQTGWRKREGGAATHGGINISLAQGTQHTLRVVWLASTKTMKMLLDGVEKFSVSFNPAALSSAKAYMASTARWVGDELLHYWDDFVLKSNPCAEDIVDANSGVLLNGATFGTGKVGQAFNLNGTGYVSIADSSNLDLSSEATFEGWVCARSFASHAAVFEKANAYMLYVGTSVEISGQKSFRPHVGVGGWYRFGSINFSATENTWYHVAYTYVASTGTMKAYIDGVEYPIVWAISPSPGEVMNNSAASLLVGGSVRGANGFNGLVDELAIYNRALSASEIQSIFQAGSAGKFKDKVPPTTTATISGTTGNNGWYTSDVTVTLTAVDDEGGCGVAQTEYSFDGSSWNVYTAPFNVSAEGTNTVYYRSVDYVGNVEGQSSPYVGLNLSSQFNSDAYSGGQNYLYDPYSGYSRYPIYPGRSYPDPQYGLIPMDMRPAGVSNVWLSRGLDRTSSFTSSITLSANVTDARCIWIVGLDGGWAYGGSPVGVSYVLNGQTYSVTYTPNDWCWAGTGAGLRLWVDRGGGIGDIAVARIDLPHSGTLSQITITDGSGSGAASIPIFAVTVGRVQSSPKSVTIKIDKTPPTVSGSGTPAPNTYGWNSTDVTVNLTAGDKAGGSGVKEIHYSINDGTETVVAGASATFALTSEGDHSVSYFAVDNAGNTASLTVSSINIDKTAPTLTFGLVSPAPNATGWNNGDVTISYTAADDLSGVDSSTSASPLSFTGEGDNLTQTVTVADKAGNTATFVTPTVKIDRTLPELIFGTPTPEGNSAGWNNTDVSISFAASDGLSGVASTSPANGLMVLTAEGTAVTGTATVIDVAGNTASFTTPAVKIDKTNPTIVISSPQVTDYLTSEGITLDFSATDSLSGIAGAIVATLDGSPAASGQIINLAGMAGNHTLTVSAGDTAGNTHSVSVDFSVTIVAEVDIDPDTLNLKSQGDRNAITAYVEFPADYDVAQIDLATVRLDVLGATIVAQLAPRAVGDHDGDGVPDLMVKFDREVVIAALAGVTGDIKLAVSGQLGDGRQFTGEDTIRVINRGK